MARNPNRRLYTVDISEELGIFRHHHSQFGQIGIPEAAVEDYIRNTLEQMLAHFDIQSVAVQSFIAHYTGLVAEGQNLKYSYHPLRYLKPLSVEQYQHYMYCLYGFAEGIYRALLVNGMFGIHGRLIASYQALERDVLYLEIRPEVPDGLYL